MIMLRRGFLLRYARQQQQQQQQQKRLLLWKQISHQQELLQQSERNGWKAFSTSPSSSSSSKNTLDENVAAVVVVEKTKSSFKEKTKPPTTSKLLPNDGLTLQHFVQQKQQHATQQPLSVSSLSSSSSSSPSQTPILFHIKTYGCQMNVNDTEIVRSILLNHHNNNNNNNNNKNNTIITFQETMIEDQADIWLTNTCAIREKAEQKVWQRLQTQKKEKDKIVGLLGCMAERLKQDILQKQLANVVVGPDAYRELPFLLSQQINKKKDKERNDDDDEDDIMLTTGMNLKSQYRDETYEDIMPQMASSQTFDNNNELATSPSKAPTVTTSAFVSIQRGCSNRCSFCIVPFTRGPERSRPLHTIVREVEQLLAYNNNDNHAGSDNNNYKKIREIVLLGQNVNSYHDTSSQALIERPTSIVNGLSNDGFRNRIKRPTRGGYSFSDLVQHVAAIDPEVRIRFTSPHPKDYPQDLLYLMAETPNICNQLHMPAQSGSTSMLQRMKRGYTREAYLQLIENVQTIIPDVALSSDFIAGFCHETQEEHLDTLSLIEMVEYEQAFLFAYSMREQTYAARKLQDTVPANIKQERLQQLIDMFRTKVHAKNERVEIGKLRLVLLEGPAKKTKMFQENEDETETEKVVEAWQGRTDQNKRIFFPYTPVLDEGQVTRNVTTFLSQSTPTLSSSTSTKSNDPIVVSKAGTMVHAGEYAVVQVTEAKGHTLRGRMLWKTTLSNFARFETNVLSTMDQVQLQEFPKQLLQSSMV